MRKIGGRGAPVASRHLEGNIEEDGERCRCVPCQPSVGREGSTGKNTGGGASPQRTPVGWRSRNEGTQDRGWLWGCVQCGGTASFPPS